MNNLCAFTQDSLCYDRPVYVEAHPLYRIIDVGPEMIAFLFSTIMSNFANNERPFPHHLLPCLHHFFTALILSPAVLHVA